MEALDNAWYGSWRQLTDLTQSFRVCHFVHFQCGRHFFPGHPYIWRTTVRHDTLWSLYNYKNQHTAMLLYQPSQHLTHPLPHPPLPTPSSFPSPHAATHFPCTFSYTRPPQTQWKAQDNWKFVRTTHLLPFLSKTKVILQKLKLKLYLLISIYQN